MRFWQCFPLHIYVFPSLSEASFPLLAFLTDHLNGTIMMVVLLLLLCLVAQLWPTLCNPMDCSPPGSSVHRDSPGKHTRMGCHALLPGDLPNPGIEPRSPVLQEDSLPSEPPGKPKNTGVGSLSFLHGTTHPRNQTGASCIAGGFFTSWASREALRAEEAAILLNSKICKN